MRWLCLAIAALAIAGCAKTNEPELPQTTAPEAVIDDPVGAVGMVEPRISIVDSAELTLPPPAFSAKGEVIFFPDSTRKVSEVREVMLRAKLTGIEKPEVLTLELSHPGGDVYEARSVTVGGSAYDTYAAEFVFPVAGTAIDRANLSGTWTARYLLGGEIVTQGTFELAP